MNEGLSNSTSSSLIRRASRGDSVAWKQIVDLYSPMIYSWCRRSGVLPDDAADIVQDVFLNASRAIGRFNHDGPNSTFRGWLRSITLNAVRHFYRKRKGHRPADGGTGAYERFLEISDYDLSAPSSESSTGGRALEVLTDLRDDFSETTWQAFWLTVVDQRSSTNVADQLGMTPAAVRKAKARVLSRMRAELDDSDESPS